MKNPRTTYLHGLLEAFSTGIVTGDPGADGAHGKSRTKSLVPAAQQRKRRKVERQRRKKGRTR